MTLSRRSERVYMDVFDIEGLCNVLAREERGLAQQGDTHAAEFLAGARCALDILQSHDCINTQRDFMEEFRAYMNNEGGANA